MPHAFSKKKDSRLESAIPTWDISLEELVPFYVEAYKAKFIDWTNCEHISLCIKLNIIILLNEINNCHEDPLSP